MENLVQQIEAIIFSCDKPVTIQEIIECLNKIHDQFFETKDIELAVDTLLKKYIEEQYSFNLVFTGGGYQFLTKPEHHDLISIFANQRSRKKLSSAAMETLAIIAYKQPVTKTTIEQIRGVNCDYSINKLLEKELISIAGRDDAPGKPILYTTSEMFMDYFGLNSINELPKPKDILPQEENTIGITGESD